MKQNDLNGIFDFLGKLRLNKISDKETKIGLIKIHMALYKKVEEFKADMTELQKKYFEGKEQELQQYNTTVVQLQSEQDADKRAELEKSLDPEMRTLVTEFNEVVNSMLNKDVDVEITPIDKDKFIEALIELDIEFTCDDLIILKDLYK